MDECFATVHDALCLATHTEHVHKAEYGHQSVVATYRIKHSVKMTAEQICKQHGTSLSAFQRKCAELLVRDYLPPKVFEQLEQADDAQIEQTEA